MATLINDNFLLQSKTAQELYHEHAAPMPIIDYHCHLSPKEVVENKRFESITQLWLGGDHYKWRALRSNGVDEHFITGDASDWEKFEKWAETMPYLFRNPLYHWTHLELKTAFGIDECLNPDNARAIYDECNRQIATDPRFCPQGMMQHYYVHTVCTTDDPIDSLEYHTSYIKHHTSNTKVYPAWRPDNAMAIEKPSWREYIHKLAAVSQTPITDFESLTAALQVRHDFFAQHGCCISDHGFDTFYDAPYTKEQVNDIVRRALAGEELSDLDRARYKHAFLLEQGRMDYAAGWAQQYHYGVIRNNNTKMFNLLGPDAGFDSMGEYSAALPLAHLLDELNSEGCLTRTILYSLNPCANEMLGTMLGNFQDGSVPGKIQLGAAWWFLDNKDGMERQMMALSNLGLLSRFVGMLTDSRSFLSYPRHEYFRRILCNVLGTEIEQGLIPYTGYEKQRVQQMVEDIAFNNAKSYFQL